jgi:hypothetical protein
MNLLLSSDLHLGRSSNRLPAEWSDEARAVAAWERLVAFALREKIHDHRHTPALFCTLLLIRG